MTIPDGAAFNPEQQPIHTTSMGYLRVDGVMDALQCLHLACGYIYIDEIDHVRSDQADKSIDLGRVHILCF